MVKVGPLFMVCDQSEHFCVARSRHFEYHKQSEKKKILQPHSSSIKLAHHRAEDDCTLLHTDTDHWQTEPVTPISCYDTGYMRYRILKQTTGVN